MADMRNLPITRPEEEVSSSFSVATRLTLVVVGLSVAVSGCDKEAEREKPTTVAVGAEAEHEKPKPVVTGVSGKDAASGPAAKPESRSNPAAAEGPRDRQGKYNISLRDKAIRLLSTQALESCRFQSRNAILSFPTARPEQGNTFLVLDIEADFPAGPGLDMMAFILRARGNINKAFFPIGFWAGPRTRPPCFCRTEDGAAGYFDADKKIIIVGNPFGKRGQIYFGYMQDKDGKDIHWPGGKASAKLLYEIPRSTRVLELARGEKFEIPLKPLPTN